MKLKHASPILSGSLLLVVCLCGGLVRGQDCNSNGVDDALDIARGTSRDCNANTVPDECDLVDERIQFEIALRYEVGHNADEIVGADFDQDGDMDMAISVRADDPGYGIVIMRNDGSLQFEKMDFVLTEEAGGPERRPLGLQGADLNGDGQLDILAQLRVSAEIAWTLSRGDGTFTEPAFLHTGAEQVRFMATADIDADGDVDVIASSRWGNTLTTILNDGGGGLTVAGRLTVVQSGHVLAEDFDGDGDADIAVLSRGEEETTPGTLKVFTSAGDGTFGPPVTHAVGSVAGRIDGRIAAADLDGNGALDLVVGNRFSGEVSLFFGNGDGSFAGAKNYSGGLAPEFVALADLDGDGDLDIAATGESPVHAGPEDLAILLNEGGASFSGPARYPIGEHKQPICIHATDMNGDGHIDVVVNNYWSGDVSVFQNSGAGTFEHVGEHRVSHGGNHDMLIHDLDGDGDLDVATASLIYNGALSVLENVTAEGFNRGCGEFVRGDVNMDGAVSAADIIMLRRFLFQGLFHPPCEDAADVTDNDLLTLCDAIAILDALSTPDWSVRLPMPSPEPGIDPTSFYDGGGDNYGSCSGNMRPEHPLGCAHYEITPPQDSSDVIAIGSIDALPGETVEVPVILTTSVPVDALQLVLEYPLDLLEIDPEGVSFAATYFDRFDDVRPMGVLTVHPEAGVATLLLAGNLILPGAEIQPGTDIVVAWLTVTVSPDAVPGTALEIEPKNGPDGEGIGPYRLRNELVSEGSARFLSSRPQTELGILNIVGDQAFFARGDANGDWHVDISDPVHTLNALFLGGSASDCPDAADANDDGAVDISDATMTLNFLFLDTVTSLPAPHPGVGIDPTDDTLTCSRQPLPAGR